MKIFQIIENEDVINDLHSIDGVLPELTVILDRNIPEEFGNEEYV